MARRRDILLNVAVVLATASALIVTALRIRENQEASRRAAASAARRVPRQVAEWREIGAVGNRWGPRSPPVTIVEFSDFRCPFCSLQAEDLREIRKRFPIEVAVVYRHLPSHGASRDAAVASECAARSGAFEAYHDLLFANADSIGMKSWTRFALEAGVTDTAAFAACFFDIDIARAIEYDKQTALGLKVSVTPTLLINEIIVPGRTPADSLEKLVRAALQKLSSDNR